MEQLDRAACYRALQTRDARFDGRFFTGVRTTGIYCRSICPARTPKLENCTFYPSAAAAQAAGFRPCLRCRPECSPDVGVWRGTSNTVSRALTLIEDGALDAEGAGVDALAARLGIGERQLRRLFDVHLGASPIAVAQTRRVLFAKHLIHETDLPMADVALASGFGSVRRFNDTFRTLYGRPPTELRRRGAGARDGAGGGVTVTVYLSYRPPYDWNAMLGFLSARAIPGVERVDGDGYRRTLRHDHAAGTVEVTHVPARNALRVDVAFPGVRSLAAVVTRVRRAFDVDADVTAIGAHLARDPELAPLVARRPGLRAPGAWDGFELAVRAVLGQQVTVGAARQLAARLVALCGDRLDGDAGDALARVFPTAAQVAAADLEALGMPRARKAALRALAAAAVADPRLFQPSGGSVEDAVARLRTVPGIGEWTAQYIALRALREPDAFPAGDVGLLRGAALAGRRGRHADLLSRAEAWRPWRAYAAQHLWAADADVAASLRRAANA